MKKNTHSIETKDKLVKTAMALFYRNGFDKTSVAEIVKQAKVSKGAFYHYFDTKIDILRSIANAKARELTGVIQKIVDNQKLNAIEKFNQVIREAQMFKLANVSEHMQIYKITENAENVRLKKEMMQAVALVISPLLERIFQQGVKEKFFDTAYPKELAVTYFDIGLVLSQPLVKLAMDLDKRPENAKIIKRQLLFFEDFLTRILGAKSGAIKFADLVYQNLLKNRKILKKYN
ncbi:MAG: TetR/AcrR family transcriptional regulator [Candidatus Buchananbacteria bacterium]|nr:TetR/AcrR family transcriptional regulator [Candidatus Buchananbacteria bacterium]